MSATGAARARALKATNGVLPYLSDVNDIRNPRARAAWDEVDDALRDLNDALAKEGETMPDTPPTCPRCARPEPTGPTPDDPNDMCREHLLAAYHALALQVTISQHAATVTQLAHEWAKARRARLSLGPVRPEPCITEPDEGTCVDVLRAGTLISPCGACEVTLERMGEKKRHTAKLSGLSARLERACLGPRPKKEDPRG